MIVMNAGVMACEHPDLDENYKVVLLVLNQFFLYAFALEMALKLVAYGPATYISDPFNCFDACLVFVSFAGYFFEQASSAVVFPSSRNPRHFDTIEGGRHSISGGRTTKNTLKYTTNFLKHSKKPVHTTIFESIFPPSKKGLRD